MRTCDDPYVPESRFKEPALCQGSYAVYRHKLWQLEPEAAVIMQNDLEVQ